MKYEEINKRFTEKVAEYLSLGYAFNTSTMSRTQSEIAKVDLTNGAEIVRIYLDRFNDGYEIIVGKCVDNVPPHNECNWATIWNDGLEVIERIRF